MVAEPRRGIFGPHAHRIALERSMGANWEELPNVSEDGDVRKR
jgi:hypothetical protein